MLCGCGAEQGRHKKILNDIGTIYVYPKRNEARLAI
jgi:hypothetical protein